MVFCRVNRSALETQMRIEFSGVVSLGDGHRTSDDDYNGAMRIGGVDIVDEVAEEKWNGKSLKVMLDGEEVANGECIAELGWGYSEWTPIDWDCLNVGECDLLSRLYSREGQSVVLVIDDGES